MTQNNESFYLVVLIKMENKSSTAFFSQQQIDLGTEASNARLRATQSQQPQACFNSGVF